MSELLQYEHLDADTLSAFVEGALLPHERETSLAHLALCTGCRELVRLSLRPVEESLPAAIAGTRRPFAGWNWLWAGAAACAGLTLASLLLFSPRASPDGHQGSEQVARTQAPLRAPVMQPRETHPSAKQEQVQVPARAMVSPAPTTTRSIPARRQPARSLTPATPTNAATPPIQDSAAGALLSKQQVRDLPLDHRRSLLRSDNGPVSGAVPQAQPNGAVGQPAPEVSCTQSAGRPRCFRCAGAGAGKLHRHRRRGKRHEQCGRRQCRIDTVTTRAAEPSADSFPLRGRQACGRRGHRRRDLLQQRRRASLEAGKGVLDRSRPARRRGRGVVAPTRVGAGCRVAAAARHGSARRHGTGPVGCRDSWCLDHSFRRWRSHARAVGPQRPLCFRSPGCRAVQAARRDARIQYARDDPAIRGRRARPTEPVIAGGHCFRVGRGRSQRCGQLCEDAQHTDVRADNQHGGALGKR